MKFASIILARKGSKRLINKNKREFLDESLFVHQIKISKKIREINKIFLSSDDEEILNIGKKNKVICLKRKKEFSTDKCSLETTLLNDIKKIQKFDKNITHLVILQASNPMMEVKYLKKGIKKIKDKNYSSIQTFKEDNFFEIGVDDFKKIRPNYQDKKPRKIETGMFWIVNIKRFLKIKNRIIEPVGYVKIKNKDVIDIDSEEDFIDAEKKMKFSYFKDTQYYYKKRKLKIKKNFHDYQSKMQIDPDGNIREPFKERQHKIELFKNEIKFVNSLKFSKKYKPKYLDLGCGTGFVTSEVSDRFTKYGLEVGKKSYDFAKKYFKYMHLGKLKQNTYNENFFDVIIFLHVIEHLTKPIETLEIIKKILKPGGIVLIGTPNFGSACSLRYGNKFRMLHDKTHISLFSDIKLCELVNDIGMKVHKIEYPYFETKYFNKQEILKIFKKNITSPAFYGNWMTIYAIKK
jgi:CMP-N-acetylneuraminic acid synthetase/2-polyprenyl-3-methyl-5-hydroxy-6-metoxy-1,4-benzoquinol methylase